MKLIEPHFIRNMYFLFVHYTPFISKPNKKEYIATEITTHRKHFKYPIQCDKLTSGESMRTNNIFVFDEHSSSEHITIV